MRLEKGNKMDGDEVNMQAVIDTQKRKRKASLAASAGSPLTVEILQALKFDLRMHVNGGEKHSTRIIGNDDYGLHIATHTDGSPNYTIVKKSLGVDDSEEITLDLLGKERDLQGFCDAYNSRANDERNALKAVIELHEKKGQDDG